MTTVTRTRLWASMRGSAAHTSATLPALANGETSEQTWRTDRLMDTAPRGRASWRAPLRCDDADPPARPSWVKVAEKRRGILGGRGVDVEARAPLEAGDFLQGGH